MQPFKPTSAAQEYVARLHQVAQETPELLVGHHLHSAHIGDLSGGVHPQEHCPEAMNLGEHEAMRSTNSDGIPDERSVKAPTARSLDACRFDQAMRSDVGRRPKTMPSTST